MGFRKRRETDLERDLRAQRPQPRDQFVQMLGRQFAATKPRTSFRAAPRIALVAAVTVVLAASLGVAGAVGYAKNSVQSFSTSVYHIVQTPSSKSTSNSQNSPNHQNGGKDGKDGSNNGGGDGDGHGHQPFHHEYDHDVDICHNGHMESVPSKQYFYELKHGKGFHRAEDCRRHK